MIRFGCDPEWVLDLDMMAFNTLVETVMRLHNQQLLDEAYTARLVAHDEGKNFNKHLKSLKKLAGVAMKQDGDAMIADLSRAGNMR